jgi:hypothetical protein
MTGYVKLAAGSKYPRMRLLRGHGPHPLDSVFICGWWTARDHYARYQLALK